MSKIDLKNLHKNLANKGVKATFGDGLNARGENVCKIMIL